MTSQLVIGQGDKVRTTLDLPIVLRERIKVAVSRGAARGQNGLIIKAIEDYLQHLEEAWIDAQFAQMQDDERYQALQLQIAKECEKSDWEALRIGEGQA
ncbi:MAG: CopG family transcriptional regulator [Chloroflexi bacterium]|nr:CopG family transcriptional regulator [Chloroflexota bacterium]